MANRVHVIGAGLAGLSAAVTLVRAGHPVTIYEAAGHAGGRCRSFFDEAIGRQIDNGNHLVLSGNQAVQEYLTHIGARNQLFGPERAEFPFFDLETGERWSVRPTTGVIPWWIFSAARRVPGSRPHEYLQALRLNRANGATTVRAALGGEGILFRRFWEPLTVAVLNAHPDEAAACLLWPVVRETFGRGETACRPRIAANGLSDCFVLPALSLLRTLGAEVRFHSRVREITFGWDRVQALTFAGDETVLVRVGESVILAVPPQPAETLVPGLETPRGSRAIVNGHFRLDRPHARPFFLGLVGGLCQWLFIRGDVASVTVSAADALVEEANEAIAHKMWREVVRALNLLETPLPAYRVIKEKRATFAQTPVEANRRPDCLSRWSNLFLAGDWTDTGLPATIESSLRSGKKAAAAVLASATSA